MFRKTLLVALLLIPLQAQAAVSLVPFLSGFNRPIFMADPNDRTGRLFVVEQGGLVKIVKNGVVLPDPFLDISNKIGTEIEQGLLGFAFDPDFRTNGRFFVNYSRKQDGATVISSFTASRTNRDKARRSSERVRLVYSQPFANHNGGHILFGPEGYLYIASGDGGSGGDPQNHGQNKRSLLGKILRIDVSGERGYRIPQDNPFVGDKRYLPEIYALGLRNPWRMSFDKRTKRLFVGDVGQDQQEEVSIVRKGSNHGWNIFEGKRCFKTDSGCRKKGFAFPIHSYGRDQGQSVTGGYVYRGKSMPQMRGKYFFADFMTGKVWTLTNRGKAGWVRRQIAETGKYLTSFAEDRAGELYLMDYFGGIWKLRYGSDI